MIDGSRCSKRRVNRQARRRDRWGAQRGELRWQPTRTVAARDVPAGRECRWRAPGPRASRSRAPPTRATPGSMWPCASASSSAVASEAACLARRREQPSRRCEATSMSRAIAAALDGRGEIAREIGHQRGARIDPPGTADRDRRPGRCAADAPQPFRALRGRARRNDARHVAGIERQRRPVGLLGAGPVPLEDSPDLREGQVCCRVGRIQLQRPDGRAARVVKRGSRLEDVIVDRAQVRARER